MALADHLELRCSAKQRFAAFVCAASVLLVPAIASANDPVAERLYRDGRAAAQAKDWTRACKMFQESQNREPAPGTLLNLADCEEHRGRLVTAAAQYQVAMRLFPAGDTRVQYAAEKAAALEKRLAKLRIRFDRDATIECDGALLESEALGTYLTLDPGEHVLVARAKGRADVRSMLRLHEGESREIDLAGAQEAARPVPVPLAGGRASESVPTPSLTAGAAPISPPPTNADRAQSPSRAPAYAMLGLGAASIGIGAVTGILALDSIGNVKTACPNRQCSSDTERSTADDHASRARSMAVVSTVSFGVGLGAAAVGTYLLLRAPGKPVVAPAVGQGSVGVLLQGTF